MRGPAANAGAVIRFLRAEERGRFDAEADQVEASAVGGEPYRF